MTQKEQIKDERYWSFLFQSLKGYIDIYPLSQKASPEKYSNNRGQKTSISSILKQLQMAPNPKAVVVRAHIACSQRERTSGLSSPLSLLIYMKVDLLSSTVIYLSNPLRLYSQSSSLESMPISDLTPLGVKQFIAIVKRQKAIRYVIKSERMLAEVTTQTSTIARVKVHRRWMCGAMEFIKVQRILCILLQTLPTVMIQYFYFESQSNCQGFIIQDVFGLFRMQIQCCLYIYKYFYVLLSFSFQNKPSIFVFELSRLDDSQTRLSFSKFFISFYNATVRLMILQWIYFSESNYIFKITLQQCQILLLYFQVELDLFPDLHKLLFRNKQNQMSKRIQTVSIPIIAYHNLYYIKFLTHMEQTVQQYDVPPPNYKPNEHATHGFSHRPSLAQITSFLVISFTIAVYFSCVMSIHQNLTLLILYCTTLAVIIVSSAQASLTNPTDRVVYYYKWSRHDKKVTFSPEYNKILFCQFCDSYCFANSKHCRTCNRCVDKFDHHCMWFNNCVGQRNYNYFFVSILSTFFYSVIFIAHVVLSSIKTNYGDRQQLTKIVFGWIGALIMAIFGFLLFNLIALHFYLIATEQTTYQFLQKRKKEEQEQKKKLNQQRQQQQKMANNKVMPEHNPQHEAVSQQSIASNNIVLVRRNEEQQDAKTDHLNKGFPVNKKIENSKIEMTYVHKQLIFNEALSVQSKGNLIDQREHEQIQSIMKDNGKSLPKFFGKNRSLKYMFPQMQAQSPSKSRKNLSDLVLRQV